MTFVTHTDPSNCSSEGAKAPPAETLKIAGITPFTSIDYPGLLSAVVFVQGCPCKCCYCQNDWMQPRTIPIASVRETWTDVVHLLQKRRGLLDGVVFSGGEPVIYPALPAAAAWAKSLGYKVGLHTSGVYPARLKALLPVLDWVGLDVKAPPQNPALYDEITRLKKSAALFEESFEAIREAGVAVEYRTTAHPDYLSEADLEALASYLAQKGAEAWVLQIYRRPMRGKVNLYPPVPEDWPSDAFVATQKARFKHFLIRRG